MVKYQVSGSQPIFAHPNHLQRTCARLGSILVGTSRCNVWGTVGARGDSVLSTLKLFKYRPTFLPICPTNILSSAGRQVRSIGFYTRGQSANKTKLDFLPTSLSLFENASSCRLQYCKLCSR